MDPTRLAGHRLGHLRPVAFRPETRTAWLPPRLRTGFPDSHPSWIANACRIPFTLRHALMSGMVDPQTFCTDVTS
jgi:hypothetical protein